MYVGITMRAAAAESSHVVAKSRCWTLQRSQLSDGLQDGHRIRDRALASTPSGACRRDV